jgi:hypothetical protein
VLDRLAATKETLRSQKRGTKKSQTPVPEIAVKMAPAPTINAADYWRVEAWAANSLARAGRHQEALALAEGICRLNVASVEANSLCDPTHYSADRRKHIVPQDPIDVKAFSREIASMTDRSQLPGIFSTCERLERQTGLSAWGEMRSALAAMSRPDASSATKGWLDAIAAAARLGRSEVEAVVRLPDFVDNKGKQQIRKADLSKSLKEGDRIVALSGR